MRSITGRFVRWYGANPLHLLVLIASLGLAGYAADKLVRMDRPLAVVIWFVGAAVLHDLVLLPLYQLIDWPLRRIGRRQALGVSVAWINHLRVPAALSGLLLLVWFPSIFRLSHLYGPTTGLSSAGFLPRWLLITGVLFLLSAFSYALRVRRKIEGSHGKN